MHNRDNVPRPPWLMPTTLSTTNSLPVGKRCRGLLDEILIEERDLYVYLPIAANKVYVSIRLGTMT